MKNRTSRRYIYKYVDDSEEPVFWPGLAQEKLDEPRRVARLSVLRFHCEEQYHSLVTLNLQRASRQNLVRVRVSQDKPDDEFNRISIVYN